MYKLKTTRPEAHNRAKQYGASDGANEGRNTDKLGNQGLSSSSPPRDCGARLRQAKRKGAHGQVKDLKSRLYWEWGNGK